MMTINSIIWFANLQNPTCNIAEAAAARASSFNFNVSTAGSEAEADPNGFAKEIFQTNSKTLGPKTTRWKWMKMAL